MFPPINENDVERHQHTGRFGRLAYRLAQNAAFQAEQRRDAALRQRRAEVVTQHGAEAEALGVPAALAWSVFAS